MEPETKHSLLDFVSTNVPTDDFFTMSHQQTLSIMASVGTGTMIGILRNQDTLMDLKFYSKSGQNAIVMRFCPLCLFSQLRFI